MPIPSKDATHSWSVADFEEYRSHQTNWVRYNVIPCLANHECRRILIRAPVKSGKREMVEYIAMRDHAPNSHRMHVFISSFHRVADEEQRKELRMHNMHVFSIVTKKKATETIIWISRQLTEGKEVIIHLDECDYGAGYRQIMCGVYRSFRDKPQVVCILYSATPEEVLLSGDVDEREVFQEFFDSKYLIYVPPPTFNGPKRFLDAGLVTDATPFFNEMGLTPQGQEAISKIRAGFRRNIGVLRLSYSELGVNRTVESKILLHSNPTPKVSLTHPFGVYEKSRLCGTQRKENKAIYQFIRFLPMLRLTDLIIIVDGDEKLGNLPAGVIQQKINWSSPTYWDSITDRRPVLVVIDQTSSRSTEWKCHDRVCFYHDYRNIIAFGTVSQAQERVNHYGEFQPIQVYGHVKTFQLSAGLISIDEYMHIDWESRKVDRRTADPDTNEPMYVIRSTSPDHTLHPGYPLPMTKNEADKALQCLGCFAEIKLSSRVYGTVKPKYNCIVTFYPCDRDTFDELIPMLQGECGVPHRFENPFIESERQGLEGDKWKGYLREWRVLDYDRDVLTQPRWGTDSGPRTTISYRGEELGVALRYLTDEVIRVNTLETRESMYNNPSE